MINPVAFNLGNLEIRWYGIIFSLAFLVGILIAARLAKKKNIDKELIYDFAVWLIPSSVIGARLGHVLGNFGYYSQNPSQIIAIWHGGVALYGGILGAIVAAVIFCRIRKVNFLDFGDIFVIPLAFGTIFGRIGNFVNQELVGKITTLPWGVNFTGYESKRHPTQIYEAIGNLAVFTILLILWRKNVGAGIIFWSYLAIYSFFRFFAEFLREGKTQILGMTTTQLIALPIILASVLFIYKIRDHRTVEKQV